MNKGRLLALVLFVATIALIAIGTLWPIPAAVAYAGGGGLLRPSSSPEAAVENLGDQIRIRDFGKAYSSLANKAEFTEPQFVSDLNGAYESLRSYATLDSFQVQPLHASATDADMRLTMRWSTVVGPFSNTRDVHVVKNGDTWAVDWPLVKEPRVPPQVIPVNYLRWDVIFRGAGDDWGAQDVEAPHIRIVDMHPLDRSDGLVIMGELLNEDVVPAYVAVKATLEGKNGAALATEGSFDKISHVLLPKQVTPFFIKFPGISLSDVGSVRMDPLSMLVPASADPVVEIQNQQFHSVPDPALTGQLSNQSGQIVNIAHVLSTFYDKNGQLVWVADQYIDRALLPQTPVGFNIPVPEDLARKISSQRTIVATYSSGGNQ